MKIEIVKSAIERLDRIKRKGEYYSGEELSYDIVLKLGLAHAPIKKYNELMNYIRILDAVRKMGGPAPYKKSFIYKISHSKIVNKIKSLYIYNIFL